jgi:hypothetical protein
MSRDCHISSCILHGIISRLYYAQTYFRLGFKQIFMRFRRWEDMDARLLRA